MKFELNGKDLAIQAEDPREVVEVIEHYRMNTAAMVGAITAGQLRHVDTSRGRANGAWFAVSCRAGVEWIEPYMHRLRKITGYAGAIPDIAAARYPYTRGVQNLCHTHIVETARLGPEGYLATGFICSGDWDGRTAEQRAAPYFAECVLSGLGATKSEPQYIRMDNGWLRENPNWLRRHPPHPELSSHSLWASIWDWWVSAHASADQLIALDQADRLHRGISKTEKLSDLLFRSYDNGLRLTWETDGLLSFEAFQEMGTNAPAEQTT